MIDIKIIILILFIHWIADFWCQTDKMAVNKSKDWTYLLQHTLIYTVVWIPFCIVTLGQLGIFFLYITLICHTITDYFTSRLNSKLWKENKTHWFFVSIGGDQILHYIQLILTYWLLTK